MVQLSVVSLSRGNDHFKSALEKPISQRFVQWWISNELPIDNIGSEYVVIGKRAISGTIIECLHSSSKLHAEGVLSSYNIKKTINVA